MFGRRSESASKSARDVRPTPTLPTRATSTLELRLSLRAAFCISTPLIVGVIIDQRLYSIIFAIGSLWAVSQDGVDDWHVRGPRLLWVALASGSGDLLGASFAGHHNPSWALIVLYAGVAVIAGYIEASNRTTAGMYLLVGTILGAGLGFKGMVWQSALALALGALWVFLVACLMNWRLRWRNQCLALAAAFDLLADVVEAIGTPQFFTVRDSAVTSLDRAQDIVGLHRRRAKNAEEVALRQSLVVALRIGEVISYLEGKGLSVDPALAHELREVARILKEANARSAVESLDTFPQRFASASGLDPAVLSALAPPSVEFLDEIRVRPFSRTPTRLPMAIRDRLRFAVILGIAIAAGTAIAVTLNDPHGFWLPMSIVFILRPDVGPVITRALARTVGTVVGVGIAGIVVLTGNAILALVLLSCMMAAIQPWAARRSHALGVMAFTPVVFVFLGLVGSHQDLFGARIIDTALAAAVVLILDLFAWTTAPSMRPAEQLQAARAAAARYEHEAALDDPVVRNRLRRVALRAVVSARSSLSESGREPRLLRRHDPTTAAQLDDVERSIDASTVSLFDRHS